MKDTIHFYFFLTIDKVKEVDMSSMQSISSIRVIYFIGWLSKWVLEVQQIFEFWKGGSAGAFILFRLYSCV